MRTPAYSVSREIPPRSSEFGLEGLRHRSEPGRDL